MSKAEHARRAILELNCLWH